MTFCALLAAAAAVGGLHSAWFVCGKHKHAMPIWQEGEGGREEGCNCSWVHVYPLLNHLSGWRAADTRRRLAKSEKLCHVCLLRLQLGTCNCNCHCHCHCKLLLSHSLPTFSLFLTRTLGVYLFIQRSEFYFISVYFHKKLLLFFPLPHETNRWTKNALKKKSKHTKMHLKKSTEKKVTNISQGSEEKTQL